MFFQILKFNKMVEGNASFHRGAQNLKRGAS